MHPQLVAHLLGLSLPPAPGALCQPAMPVELRPRESRTGHQVPESVCGVVSGEPCEGCRCFTER
jgi:hypothetical protein